MNGFYNCETAVDNLPSNVDSVKYGTLLVLNRSLGRTTQLYVRNVADAPIVIAWRIQTDDGWTDWQFDNPPMLKGIVYRTTEQYNKAIIYKKIDTDNVIKWSIDNGSTWKPAREYLSAAPDGYGLGGNAASLPNNDADQAVNTGWYLVNNTSTNCPAGGSWGLIRTERYYANAIWQTYYSLADTGWAMRVKKSDSSWEEWSWIDCPCIAGVQYRTSERYKSKPVYIKVVDCGYITNGKTIEIVSDTYRLIDCRLKGNPQMFPMLPEGGITLSGWQGGFYCGGKSITLYAGASLAASNHSVTAIAKYIEA